MKKKIICALTSAILLSACAQNTPTALLSQTDTPPASYTLDIVQAIPSPAAMKANVLHNARTSTVVDIDVAYVGKQIPFTFSDGKVANSDGFDWYVSKHFALKTDYPAERAKFFLELLELSYPYYVEFFGIEPANIRNQRIASTYATTVGKLRLAMFDDGFNRGVHHTAGGEAMYYNQVGYSFPTERPQHQRYIAIHETMHSYQMAVGNYPWTPSWHGEGLGDSLANHVFDSEKKQLAVFGHDVPIFDVVSQGIDVYSKEKPTLVDIHNRAKFNRGLNVLFVQFMYNNPEYSQYMKIYHQEIIKRQTASRAESLTVLQDIVPNWDALEQNFKQWAENIVQTHEVATRGQWEMDGNMFYKRKTSYQYGPQRLGFNMTPAQIPGFTPFQNDFPQAAASSLTLPAKRGVAQPTLAYVINFDKAQITQGSIGMALGAQSTAENTKAKQDSYWGWKGANTDTDPQLRVEIKSANTLVIDGRTLGAELKEIALPLDIIESINNQDKPQLGVSIQIKQTEVIYTLKAKNANTFIVELPITAGIYAALINNSFGLVSTDNQHGITPFIDDGRDLNPNKVDLATSAPTNAWAFKGDSLSLRFARAIWKAGDAAPKSWQESFNQLSSAALNRPTADKEVATVVSLLPSLAKEGAGLNDALAELSGLELKIDWIGKGLDSLNEVAILTNHGSDSITLTLAVTAGSESAKSETMTINPGQRLEVPIENSLLALSSTVSASISYIWNEQQIDQTITQKSKQYRGFEMPQISAQYNEGQLTLSGQLNGPFSGDTSGHIIYDLFHGQESERHSQAFTMQPYDEKALEKVFTIDEKSLEHDAWFEITVIADVDGEPVTLRKRLPFVPQKLKR
ncbi:hypothetical protein JK628_12830 [Shewanella sp. KX20019]|uniref:hypothetical protein n=1 Tax=Shewanella sp. KX20019 TaxID=2803864 RepID=UPI0019265A3F|nr:hypothetical protein [Shewanella sp. KX20019]QQX78471.1 hypothetical protein JK628_12830 [Shewanella sp. KX20019]